MYNRQFTILFIAHLLFCSMMSSLTLTSLYVKELGGNEATMGVVSAMGVLGGLLLRPFWGGMLDNWGRRRAFLLGGMVVPITFFLQSAMSSVHHGFLLNCLVQGIAIGGTFATFFTYINDICPRERISEGVAIFGISGLIGMAIGPTMGEWIWYHYGFVVLFRFLGFFAIIPLVMCRFLPETLIAKPSLRISSLRQFRQVMSHSQLLPFWMVLLAFGCALASQRTFLAPWSEQNGIGSVSYFFTTYAIASTFLRLSAAHFPERFGKVAVLLPAICFYAVSHIVLAVCPSKTGLILAGVCGGVGHTFMFPVLNTLVIEYAGNAQRGMGTSCFVMALDVGGISGNFLLGQLAAYTSIAWVFCIIAGLLLCVCWIVWRTHEEYPHKTRKPHARVTRSRDRRSGAA